MKIKVLLLSVVIIYVFTNCANNDSQQYAALPEIIDFNFDVKPILSDRCYTCHGPDENTREADLRFDIKEGAFKESEDGGYTIIPGNADSSLLVHRIFTDNPDDVMPPADENLFLSPREKAILKKWIEQGAEWKKHWSFIPPVKADLPKVKDESWTSNELDYFVLDKLADIGLSPNMEADKYRLLKRLSYDLTGLPPSPELQESFINDDSPTAYEKIVDQLLANKHYGEKLALNWLDVARYADSHGYQDDGLRTMWPFRDWVIHALNENYSYKKFVTWQLAGDLLPEPNKEMILATGFNRNHKITQEGGVIDEEYRVEYVSDRTNTFGKAFLGLTLECAKCHDHKYDPISMEDYYGTFGFFNKVPEKGIFGTIDASFADPPNMSITKKDTEEILDFINLKDSMVNVMVMHDSVGLRPSYLLNRGNYDQREKEVELTLPGEILPFSGKYETNRVGLSEWLFADDNPLTSRVFVNRIWQEIFGTGIVKTAGDFGIQGELPSHADLLDWLAVDFKENGWDIKYLLKKIVMSSTYKQSSEMSEEKINIDPENRYLSMSPRYRYAAELVRDHILSSSGLLNQEIGGPSVKTYQPKGLWDAATSGRGLLQKYNQDDGDKLYRRGMYQFIKRTVPPPVMLMFDASNRDICEVRRIKTSTPLQALAMLNDPHVLEAARVLSQKLVDVEMNNEMLYSKAFSLILCREISVDESQIFADIYKEYKDYYVEAEEDAKEILSSGEYPLELEKYDVSHLAAIMQVIHAMYNMEESITRS